MAYQIQQGDTLQALARKNKTTVDALMKANPNIKNMNQIRAGDQLNMGIQASTPAPANAPVKPLSPGAQALRTVGSTAFGPISSAANIINRTAGALNKKANADTTVPASVPTTGNTGLTNASGQAMTVPNIGTAPAVDINKAVKSGGITKPTLPSLANTQTQTNTQTNPTPTTPTQNTQTTTPAPKPQNAFAEMVGGLSQFGGQTGQEYKNLTNELEAKREQLRQLQDAQAKREGMIASEPGLMSVQQGRLGAQQKIDLAQQNNLAEQISGLASQLGAANTQQGLQIGALGTAAGFAQPQFQSYTNAQFNPLTGEYNTVGGGQYGAGPAAAANIGSIGQAQTGINNIIQNAPAIDNQFSAIANYAQQAGLTGNSPILEGFRNKFGANFLTNPAVIGFNQALESLNKLLQDQGEAPINPDTATYDKILQAQQTVKANLARKQGSYQNFVNQFSSSGGSSGSSSNLGNWGWNPV